MKLVENEVGYSGFVDGKRRVKCILTGFLLCSAGLLPGACGAETGDDHGHEHGSQTEEHEHGEDVHSHPAAPATEAYYGEEAEMQGREATGVPEEGDQPSASPQDGGHSHDDGDEHAHDH